MIDRLRHRRVPSHGTSLFLVLCTWPLAAPALAQEAAPGQESREAAQIERLIQIAREGQPVVRPQAAQRLIALGLPAVERLLAECGPEGTRLAALGPELVAILGPMGDPRLRGLAWNALRDPDFPWRPAAANGLAGSAAASLSGSKERSEEGARFVTLCSDPIAAVRAAGVEGLGELGLESEREHVRALLADPDGLVRRRAAELLVRWGDPGARAWLLAELQHDDRFFSLPTGKMARYDAWKVLREDLGEGVAFDPEADPTDMAEALDVLRGRFAASCPHPPELPPQALPGAPTPGDVLGLELRSCRRGEFFLRWNEADVLYVGLGNPAAVHLPQGTVAGLLEAARQAARDLGQERFWGAPGCDLERFHAVLGEGPGVEVMLISKGPEVAGDLRPAPLDALAEVLLATLPEDGADPRLADLRARVRDALAVLGGPLDAPR